MYTAFPRLVRVVFSFVLVTMAASVAAQEPQTPPLKPVPPLPSPWDGSAGVGFTLNRGNTANTNVNLSFEAKRDAHAGTVWKFKGLYLRGDTNGVRAIDRLLLDSRHEYSLSAGIYGFTQLQFLEDRFKAIDYLWAPGVGVGYRLIDSDATTLHVDAGLGVKVEKNLPPRDGSAQAPARVDGDVTLADKFEHTLAKDTKLTQSFGALWRAGDFGDALYTVSAAITAPMTAHTQLKVEALDTYSTRPAEEHVTGNDVAVITAFVYKF